MAEGYEKEEAELSDSASKLEEGTPDDAKIIDKSEDYQMPSKKEEEELIKKKYGGLLLKNPPLISKDSDRAFFDSADWALGKKTKGPVEALRPKLQPTPHPQTRSRSAYARPGDGEDVTNTDMLSPSNKNPGKDDVSPEGNQGNEGSDCHCLEKENQPN